MKINTDDYGLVLSGGGGKGGYQIGVWKALLESKTMHIGAVSGTSVGALNAALYAMGDYEKAENVWLNISREKILTEENLTGDIGGAITTLLISLIPQSSVLTTAASVARGFRYAVGGVTESALLSLTKLYVKGKNGFFSRSGLIEIINESGISEKIPQSHIPCFATAYNISHSRLTRFCLNNEGKERISKILLATSAIPIAFPKEEISGCMYYDGGLPGVGDNIPVSPLYDLGYRKFIVVHLSRDGVEKFERKFPDARFMHVIPKDDQGGFFTGTLDFDAKSASRRIEQGYRDMKDQIALLNQIDKSLQDRNDKTDEIHTYSGKYYKSMNDIMDRTIAQLDTTLYIEDSEFKLQDMDMELTALAQNMTNNKTEMDKFVLDGITNISAMGAQMDELYNLKPLKRIWNGLTGKNARLKKSIDNNQLIAQQATMKMISKLAEADAMSVELLRTIQCQLQGATVKMAHVLEQQGHEIAVGKEKQEEIVRMYCELVLKDKEFATEFENLYSALSDSSRKNDRRFNNLEEEIADIKVLQKLQNWCINIEYQSYGSRDYRELDVYEKIICITSDFFYLTRGNWDDELILFVKSSLDSLGILPKEIVDYTSLLYKIISDDDLRSYLFNRNGIFIYTTDEDDADIIPHYEAVSNGISIGRRVWGIEDVDLRIWIDNYIKERTGGIGITGGTAFDIVCELLVIMKQYSTVSNKNCILPQYRDIHKQALLGEVHEECKYVRLLAEHNYMDEVLMMITDMDKRISGDPEFDDLKRFVYEKCLL